MSDTSKVAESLKTRIRRLHVSGSYAVALETLLLLRNYITSTRWKGAGSLLADVREIGRHLVSAHTHELALGNMVGRVLHLIRLEEEEIESDNYLESVISPATTNSISGSAQPPKQRSMSTMLKLMEDRSSPKSSSESYNFKSALVQSIKEVIDEVESVDANISSQANEHIFDQDIILTMGFSKTVESLLKEGAKSRSFQVLVAETWPKYSRTQFTSRKPYSNISISMAGQEMSLSLSKSGIKVTLIPDSAVFAVMPRVTKVIVGASGVIANGGFLGVSGMNNLTAAAKFHSKPVIVTAGVYAISPLYPYDTEKLNILSDPNALLGFEETELIEKVDALHPLFDYVGPDLVSLLITNVGPHPPSHISRLVEESYSREDVDYLYSGYGV
ncbi:Translation initiation factor eIF-2B subunit beta [Nowakowskiella sp. JEL0407]|nr:Translation initiation factor eIF-2B subunit beta [Nowakowskiella sp. JEL0407]